MQRVRFPMSGNFVKEKTNGNNSLSFARVDAAGSISCLESQPPVGIRTEWRIGSCFDRRFDTGALGKDLTAAAMFDWRDRSESAFAPLYPGCRPIVREHNCTDTVTKL